MNVILNTPTIFLLFRLFAGKKEAYKQQETGGLKLYNDQRNAQVFLFIYQFTSALHVSGFFLARLQRQVYTCL
jgi:hypothetical protein